MEWPGISAWWELHVVWSGVEVCTTKEMKGTVAERYSALMGRLSGKSVEVGQPQKAAVSCQFERCFVNPSHSYSCNYDDAECVACCYALGFDNR